MTIDEIKEIIQLLNESGIGELEVQRGENRVWLKRAGQDVQYTIAAPVSNNVPHQVQPAPAPPVLALPAAEEILPMVKAPIVGTFYE